MRRMSREEALAFLAAGARTATVATLRPDGGPHVVPVWFVVDAGAIVFTCAADSVKARNLARDARAAVSVDDEAFPYAFATAEGRVEVADRPPDLQAWTTRIAHRYVGDARAREYGARNAEYDDLVVRLLPARLFGGADVAL